MAYGMKDRVREQVSSFSGSGAVTLPNSAVSGFQTFLSGWGASGTGEYCLQMGSQWETGFGTLNAGGTQLTRTTVYDGSSGVGVTVNFNLGTLDCFGDIPAALAHHLNIREITVTSAATTDIGAVNGLRVAISGTTGPITSYGTSPNRLRFVRHAGSSITHNGTSLILQGGVSRVTSANDIQIIASDASGNWRELAYFPADTVSLATFPQGRLTLATGVPVMTSTVTGASTVFYTPYIGRFVSLYDGARVRSVDIGGELSQATTDSTKSPAACVANKNYDVFVWFDSGTYRSTRGPAWSTDTARGTGAGTTELQMINGIWTNKYDITNGPTANRGTYVGTVRTNGSSQVDYIFGAISAGGTAGSFGVWNMYNRVRTSTFVGDSGDSWTYNSTTWRAGNNSATIRVSFVIGLQEDSIEMRGIGFTLGAASDTGVVGIGFDATNSASGLFGFGVNSANTSMLTCSYETTALGWHFASFNERSTAANAVTLYGDAGGLCQTGMAVSLMN